MQRGHCLTLGNSPDISTSCSVQTLDCVFLQERRAEKILCNMRKISSKATDVLTQCLSHPPQYSTQIFSDSPMTFPRLLVNFPIFFQSYSNSRPYMRFFVLISGHSAYVAHVISRAQSRCSFSTSERSNTYTINDK